MSVHSTLLKNKLFIPPLRRRAVERQRLLSRLTEGVGGPLTLVSAPAGFGKTTLLAAWSARQVLPVAWVSLDEADNDPVRFLSYVIAALHTIIAGVGNEAQVIVSQSQPAALQAAVTALINELDTVVQPFVLLLDDYHTITEPAVHDVLAFLIEHLPPAMHVLLATRADPPLPLARLRARGQLVEVRAADLRFTPDEAAELFNQVMGLQLTAQDIDALERRTEGWIAGLQMAAIALQGRDDAAEFAQAFSGSHRYVLDYLVEEVLSRQPEPVQAFLLRTAILERMCKPLCEAVLRGGEGEHGRRFPLSHTLLLLFSLSPLLS